MTQESNFMATRDGIAVAALMLAENVETVHVDGYFDAVSQTWSDRSFACASAKKHNEAM